MLCVLQADALAYGKTPERLRSENVPDYLIPHKSFTGNRPSMSILLPELDAFTVGQLLALYEHRVATQVRACWWWWCDHVLLTLHVSTL